MKWMGCLNGNLQHATSEKPRESPTATFTHRPSISGWHCIHMIISRRIWYGNSLYMYVRDLIWVWSGWDASITSQHMLWEWETMRITYFHHWGCETQHISGWHCILMTTSCSRRCENALYMYKVDLPWVWNGWGASIITYSMMQARNQVNCLLPLLYLPKSNIRLKLHPYDH